MKRLAMGTALLAVLGLTTLFSPAPPAHAQETDPGKLAVLARAALMKNCSECHGVTRSGGRLDVRDHKVLTTPGKRNTYIVPRDLAKSYAWQRIADGEMPPSGDMAAADKEVIKRWIEAGAPEPPVVVAARRPYVSTRDVLTAVYQHMLAADEEDRPYLRYFTMQHLHNNPAIDESKLARFRAALSKVLNSMHWKKPIVLPQQIDKHGTVFAIDLRDLDWDRKDALYEKYDRWAVMMQRYPYGLAHEDPDDDGVEKVDRDLYKMARGTLVMMRADWFIARASRPPLYEQVLRLPANARILEHKLGVDAAGNFRRNRLARAGFARSFVSSQNRLVERHDALYGAYWKSYDFKKGSDQGDLLQFPLGPQRGLPRGKDPYADVAFKHDGGEMIFHLPNGLQAYYLVDGKDNYITKGPVDVVSDAKMRSGTTEIVNGLSCMCCHVKGMIDSVIDDVRGGTAVQGDNLRKVKQLYPGKTRMLKYVDDDREQFLASLTRAMTPFLGPEDRERKIDEVKEPITELVQEYYHPDPRLDAVAYELGYEKPEELKAAIKNNEKLRDLGLRTLLDDRAIKREFWDNGDRLEKPDEDGPSLYQRVANALGRGSRRAALR